MRGRMALKIHDVSLRVREGMMVYEGNPQPKVDWVKKMPERTANESVLTLGSHTGTHMDAELHAKSGGWKVSELKLEKVVGKCRVLDLADVEIGAGIGEKELAGFGIKKGEIIVLKTKNSGRGFGEFKSDFVHVSMDGAEYLVKCGIAAVGIDSLGIQKFHSGNMKVHQVFLENGIPIFEGLDLGKVVAGEYFFVGLPINVEAEAAPARVILIEGLKE